MVVVSEGTLPSVRTWCFSRGSKQSTKPQTTPSGRPVHAAQWGITKVQLEELLAHCASSPTWDEKDNVRAFVQKFVETRTAGSGMGLSLSLNCDAPKAVDLMVSHSWDENAAVFIQDVIREMRDDEVAFICFLAIYQGGMQAIQDQLGDVVSNGPFVQVIQEITRIGGRMLVVPNEELKANGQGLYSRMWCDFEIYTALRLECGVQFATGTSLEHLFGSKTDVASRKARCGNPIAEMNEDERMIRQEIETMPAKTIEQRGASYLVGLVMLYFGGTALTHLVWVKRIEGPTCSVGREAAVLYYLCFVLLWVPTLPLRWAASALVGWAKGKRDGYEELDDCIRRAAHFQLRFPGKTMDPKTWKPKARPIKSRFSRWLSGRYRQNFEEGVIIWCHVLYLPLRWGTLMPLASTAQCLEWSLLGLLSFVASFFIIRMVRLARGGYYQGRDGPWQALVDAAFPVCFIAGSACGAFATQHFVSALWAGCSLGFVLTIAASVRIFQLQPARKSLMRSTTFDLELKALV